MSAHDVAARGVAAMVAARLAADPGRPLITYYDDATGERTELSAATLDNWVAKTANLLTDSLGVAPGDLVAIDLPAHWQTVAVVLAAWTGGLDVWLPAGPHDNPPAGLTVAFVAEADRATRPDPDAGDLVVLALRPFGAPLAQPDPAVVDYAAEVGAHGDRFAAPAAPVAQAALLAGAREQAAAWGLAPGDRVLALADRADAPGVGAWLLAPLVAGASVVLCRAGAGPGAGVGGAAVFARRIGTERVTATWGPVPVEVDGVRVLSAL